MGFEFCDDGTMSVEAHDPTAADATMVGRHSPKPLQRLPISGRSRSMMGPGGISCRCRAGGGRLPRPPCTVSRFELHLWFRRHRATGRARGQPAVIGASGGSVNRGGDGTCRSACAGAVVVRRRFQSEFAPEEQEVSRNSTPAADVPPRPMCHVPVEKHEYRGAVYGLHTACFTHACASTPDRSDGCRRQCGPLPKGAVPATTIRQAPRRLGFASTSRGDQFDLEASPRAPPYRLAVNDIRSLDYLKILYDRTCRSAATLPAVPLHPVDRRQIS